MTIARLSGYEELSVMHDGLAGKGSVARHDAASTVSRRAGRRIAATERAGTPWKRVSPQQRRHLDVPALVGAGVPLTLLMDLADPSGPDSSAIYWGEPALGPDSWIR